jgi:hypothetical protein
VVLDEPFARQDKHLQVVALMIWLETALSLQCGLAKGQRDKYSN